jgi:hypothetical protein
VWDLNPRITVLQAKASLYTGVCEACCNGSIS